MENFAENINKKFSIVEVPTIKMSEVEQRKNFKIKCLKRVATKYGGRIVLETSEFKVFLPIRYKTLTDKEIKILSSGSFVFINDGEIGKSYKIRFIPIETIDLEEEEEEVDSEDAEDII